MLFVAAVAAAILAVPRPAVAHAVLCPELWNPHGQTTPPAGSTTLPGAKGGQNEDGFFEVVACSVPGSLVCPSAPNPFFKSPCFCDTVNFPGTVPEGVLLFDAGDGCEGGILHQYSFNGDFEFDFGTVIKYTEANGKTQDITVMAGNNNPNDNQAQGVAFHLWGKGDLLVCSAVDPSSCTCCRVPPPPK